MTEPTLLTLRYSLRFSDLYRAAILYSPPWRVALIAGLSFGAFSLISVLATASDSSEQVLRVWLMSTMGFGLFFGMVWTVGLLPFIAWRSARANASLTSDLQLSLREAAVEMITPRSNARFEWHELWGFKQGWGVMLLMLTRMNYFVIPYRVLSAAQITEIGKTLAANGVRKRQAGGRKPRLPG